MSVKTFHHNSTLEWSNVAMFTLQLCSNWVNIKISLDKKWNETETKRSLLFCYWGGRTPQYKCLLNRLPNVYIHHQYVDLVLEWGYGPADIYTPYNLVESQLASKSFHQFTEIGSTMHGISSMQFHVSTNCELVSSHGVCVCIFVVVRFVTILVYIFMRSEYGLPLPVAFLTRNPI